MEGMELPLLGTHSCRSWGFEHSEDYVPAPRGFPGLSDITFASEALAAPRALVFLALFMHVHGERCGALSLTPRFFGR